MKSIIQFVVQKGPKYYTAQGVDIAVVTQAKTLDELAVNIKEALELHLKDEPAAHFGFTPQPSVLINFELPRLKYA